MQAPRGGAQGAATPRSLISFDPRQTGFVAAVRRRASLLISVFVLLAVLHKYDYLIFATRLVLIGGALFLYMLFSSQSRMLYAPQPGWWRGGAAYRAARPSLHHVPPRPPPPQTRGCRGRRAATRRRTAAPPTCKWRTRRWAWSLRTA